MSEVLPKVSVIVPVYKVEEYLRQCIESIIVQTYANLEIVLVDDGSPDNCGKICDEYAEKDARIIVIHKQNGGLSDARNVGIEVATGEYLTFVDSDDWLENDMVETLYNNIVNHNADISCCGYYFSYVGENVASVVEDGLYIFSGSENMIMQYIVTGIIDVIACCKLYKAYIFKETRYPYGKIHEDNYAIIDVLSLANTIVVDNTPKYYYRQRKSGIAGSADALVRAENLVNMADENKIKIEDRFDNPALGQLILFKYYVMAIMFIIFDKKHNKNRNNIYVFTKALNEIRDNFYGFKKNKYLSQNDKLKLWAIKISVNFYKLLQMVNNKSKGKMQNNNLALFD